MESLMAAGMDGPAALAELGPRLRRARTARGWSLKAVAARAGIDDGYLSKLERGIQQNPTIEVLNNLVGALGFATLTDLWAATEDPAAADQRGRANTVLFPRDWRAAHHPVYRLDRFGPDHDPRDPHRAPPYEYDDYVPAEATRSIDPAHGAKCYAVIQTGTSLKAARIPDGAVCWMDPALAREPRHGDVVLARPLRADGAPGRVLLARFQRRAGPDGEDCLAADGKTADGAHDARTLHRGPMDILGIVVWVTHPPR